MGIKIKENNGDLTGSSKAERKAREEKMGRTASKRANQIKERSESGFKGEDKNEYGLPKGGQLQIQDNAYESGDNSPKFRKGKNPTYADGTKGIKIKKNVAASDATRVKSPMIKKIEPTYGERLGSMTDTQLDDEVTNQLENEKFDYTKMNDGPKYKQSLDSLVSRKIRKGDKFGKLEKGTSGIKVEMKADKAK